MRCVGGGGGGAITRDQGRELVVVRRQRGPILRLQEAEKEGQELPTCRVGGGGGGDGTVTRDQRRELVVVRRQPRLVLSAWEDGAWPVRVLRRVDSGRELVVVRRERLGGLVLRISTWPVRSGREVGWELMVVRWQRSISTVG